MCICVYMYIYIYIYIYIPGFETRAGGTHRDRTEPTPLYYSIVCYIIL